MKRAMKPEDIIELPMQVYDSQTGETHEWEEAPAEIQQRAKVKVSNVWYRAAALAVKRQLTIDFEIRNTFP